MKLKEKHRILNMRIYFVILLLIMPLFAIGQASTPFIGTWKVDVDKSIDRMDVKVKAKFDSLTEAQRLQITDAFKVLKFTFNEDSTVVSSSIKDNQVLTRTGAWSIESESSGLVIVTDGKAVRFTYQFVSPGALILSTANSKWWFNETYLIKN